MPTNPTDEEMGMQILNVFDERIRPLFPGCSMPMGVFLAASQERRWPDDGLIRGRQWLAENGYVEDDGRHMRVMQKGIDYLRENCAG